jgi:hypothetical protein
VTVVAESTVNVHVPVPLHGDDHPTKVEPGAGAAVNVTDVPYVSFAEQAECPVPQSIGPPVIVPAPLPLTTTLRSSSSCVNSAVADFAAVIATEQVAAVPEHAPLQLASCQPVIGAAVSVTDVPYSNELEHADPQSIVPGDDVTAPLPIAVTLSNSDCSANVAVAACAPWTVVAHVVDDPKHAPLQLENVEFAPAFAVSITAVPAANVAEQLASALPVHAIPAGLELTAPLPWPASITASVPGPSTPASAS